MKYKEAYRKSLNPYQTAILHQQAKQMGHMQVFGKRKDSHKGKDCIIFCTGPSLNDYTPIPEHDDAIKIGVKSMVFKPEIELDYYFCGDLNSRTFCHLNKIAELKCTKFAFTYVNGQVCANDFKEAKSKVKKDPKKIRYWFTKDLAQELGCLEFAISHYSTFNHPIPKYPAYKTSIAFPALQFAELIGCKRIFLVGSDCTNVWSFREPEKRSKFKPFPDKILPHWISWHRYLKKNRIPIEMVSINPIGLKGIFEDRYTCKKYQ